MTDNIVAAVKQEMKDFKEIYQRDREDEVSRNEKLDVKLDAILLQTTRTNGRVTKLEDSVKHIKLKSIGIWISNNPLKFAVIFLGTLSLLISDVRQPILEYIAKFIFK